MSGLGSTPHPPFARSFRQVLVRLELRQVQPGGVQCDSWQGRGWSAKKPFQERDQAAKELDPVPPLTPWGLLLPDGASGAPRARPSPQGLARPPVAPGGSLKEGPSPWKQEGMRKGLFR